MTSERHMTDEEIRITLLRAGALVRHFKTVSAAARATGIVQQTISAALRNKRVGPRVAREIEQAWRAAGLGPTAAVDQALALGYTMKLLPEAIESVATRIGNMDVYPLVVIQQMLREDARLRSERGLPPIMEELLDANTMFTLPPKSDRH